MIKRFWISATKWGFMSINEHGPFSRHKLSLTNKLQHLRLVFTTQLNLFLNVTIDRSSFLLTFIWVLTPQKDYDLEKLLNHDEILIRKKICIWFSKSVLGRYFSPLAIFWKLWIIYNLSIYLLIYISIYLSVIDEL